MVVYIRPLGGELTSWNLREMFPVKGIQTWREERGESEHVNLVATAVTTSCSPTVEDGTVRPQAGNQSPLPPPLLQPYPPPAHASLAHLLGYS